jgi:hypothetical protein
MNTLKKLFNATGQQTIADAARQSAVTQAASAIVDGKIVPADQFAQRAAASGMVFNATDIQKG